MYDMWSHITRSVAHVHMYMDICVAMCRVDSSEVMVTSDKWNFLGGHNAVIQWKPNSMHVTWKFQIRDH